MPLETKLWHWMHRWASFETAAATRGATATTQKVRTARVTGIGQRLRVCGGYGVISLSSGF
jgi:hypothetical protein